MDSVLCTVNLDPVKRPGITMRPILEKAYVGRLGCIPADRRGRGREGLPLPRGGWAKKQLS